GRPLRGHLVRRPAAVPEPAAEALPARRSGAVADRSDRRPEPTTALADAVEGERRLLRVDVAAPLVAARGQRVGAERVVAAPRRGRRVGIAARAAVERADHPELGRLA